MREMKRALIVFAALMLSACQPPKAPSNQHIAEQDATAAQITVKNTAKETAMIIVGRIIHKRFEGGFFALDADDGNKYLPMGLPKEYRQHGLRVKVSGEVINDLATTVQYGKPLRVISVEPLSEVLKKPASDPTL